MLGTILGEMSYERELIKLFIIQISIASDLYRQLKAQNFYGKLDYAWAGCLKPELDIQNVCESNFLCGNSGKGRGHAYSMSNCFLTTDEDVSFTSYETIEYFLGWVNPLPPILEPFPEPLPVHFILHWILSDAFL